MGTKIKKYLWSLEISGEIVAKNRSHALEIAKKQILNQYMPMVPAWLMDRLEIIELHLK